MDFTFLPLATPAHFLAVDEHPLATSACFLSVDEQLIALSAHFRSVGEHPLATSARLLAVFEHVLGILLALANPRPGAAVLMIVDTRLPSYNPEKTNINIR